MRLGVLIIHVFCIASAFTITGCDPVRTSNQILDVKIFNNNRPLVGQPVNLLVLEQGESKSESEEPSENWRVPVVWKSRTNQHGLVRFHVNRGYIDHSIIPKAKDIISNKRLLLFWGRGGAKEELSLLAMPGFELENEDFSASVVRIGDPFID